MFMNFIYVGLFLLVFLETITPERGSILWNTVSSVMSMEFHR